MLSPTQLASRKVLPASAILTDPEDTRPYECDGLTLVRQQPMVVLLPDNEGQSVEILKLTHAARLPVVARGAGHVHRGQLVHPELPRF